MKKANERITDQQNALMENEQLKTLLQKTGSIAHELNQPLTYLIGNIDLLEMIGDNPEKHAQCLSRIRQAGLSISEIVKKIQNIRYKES